jgi:hypothetical protein
MSGCSGTLLRSAETRNQKAVETPPGRVHRAVSPNQKIDKLLPLVFE